GLAAHDGALVAVGERVRAVGEGVGRRVDVEEERPPARRVVARGAVDGAAVEDHQGSRGPREVVALLGPRPRQLFLSIPEEKLAWAGPEQRDYLTGMLRTQRPVSS